MRSRAVTSAAIVLPLAAFAIMLPCGLCSAPASKMTQGLEFTLMTIYESRTRISRQLEHQLAAALFHRAGTVAGRR